MRREVFGLLENVYENDAGPCPIFRQMGGRSSPRGWADGGLMNVEYKLGSSDNNVTVEVNNVLTEIQIHNVFGVIKGFVDPGTSGHFPCRIFRIGYMRACVNPP